jgi:hypothetical protein
MTRFTPSRMEIGEEEDDPPINLPEDPNVDAKIDRLKDKEDDRCWALPDKPKVNPPGKG